jgi:hypothetical protein
VEEHNALRLMYDNEVLRGKSQLKVTAQYCNKHTIYTLQCLLAPMMQCTLLTHNTALVKIRHAEHNASYQSLLYHHRGRASAIAAITATGQRTSNTSITASVFKQNATCV